MVNVESFLGGAIRLDCYFVGDRDYIQGSQILGALAKYLIAQSSQELRLLEAKFMRLCTKEVFASDVLIDGMDSFGHCVVKIGDDEVTYSFYSGDLPIKKRVSDTSAEYLTLESDADLEGRVEFQSRAADFEKLLRIIISSTKSLHSRLDPKIRDVWFTGINKANIALFSDLHSVSGSFRLSNVLKFGVGQVYTLTKVDFDGVGVNEGDFEPFLVGFTYKDGTKD
jgi:hypothetical protein